MDEAQERKPRGVEPLEQQAQGARPPNASMLGNGLSVEAPRTESPAGSRKGGPIRLSSRCVAPESGVVPWVGKPLVSCPSPPEVWVI